MAEKITVELKKPIQFGSELITKIEFFKEIKAKHLRDMPMSNEMKWGDFLTVAQKISDRPPSVFDELSFEDLGQIANIVGEALGAGGKTGNS